jgi:hypothetical protein
MNGKASPPFHEVVKRYTVLDPTRHHTVASLADPLFSAVVSPAQAPSSEKQTAADTVVGTGGVSTWMPSLATAMTLLAIGGLVGGSLIMHRYENNGNGGNHGNHGNNRNKKINRAPALASASASTSS